MSTSSARISPGTPRPVYVAAKGGMSIDVQAQALRFRCERLADSYIPFRHISRLVVEEHVDLDLEVMCQCARQGIPVIVYQPQHGVLLRIIGHGGEDMGLRERLLDLTLDMNWSERIHDWRAANQARIAAIVARRLKAPLGCQQSARLNAWIGEQAAALAGRKIRRTTQKLLYTCILSKVQQELLTRGLDARSEAWLYDSCDLPALIGQLVLLQIQPLRLHWLKTRAEKATENGGGSDHGIECEMISLFEKHTSRVDKTISDILNRLHRWLVDAT